MTHSLKDQNIQKGSLSKSAWSTIEQNHNLQKELTLSERKSSQSVCSENLLKPLQVNSDASTAEPLSPRNSQNFVNNCSHFVKKYTILPPEIYLFMKLSMMHFFEMLEYINNAILMFILDTMGVLDIL